MCNHISDCSIGQLIWPLSESDRINGGGGAYLLPAALFQYTLVSFTVMKGTAVIEVSGCMNIYHCKNYLVKITHE